MKWSTERPGADAGWRVLFAPGRSRPRAAQAGRSPTMAAYNFGPLRCLLNGTSRLSTNFEANL